MYELPRNRSLFASLSFYCCNSSHEFPVLRQRRIPHFRFFGSREYHISSSSVAAKRVIPRLYMRRTVRLRSLFCIFYYVRTTYSVYCGQCERLEWSVTLVNCHSEYRKVGVHQAIRRICKPGIANWPTGWMGSGYYTDTEVGTRFNIISVLPANFAILSLEMTTFAQSQRQKSFENKIWSINRNSFLPVFQTDFLLKKQLNYECVAVDLSSAAQ